MVHVARDLERAAAVDERHVGEVVPARRQRKARELARGACAVVRRRKIGRIQTARGLHAGKREVETSAPRDRRVVADRAVDVGIRTERRVGRESGRSGSGASRHVEHGTELEAVLRRVRSLDHVDEREIVEIDLAADIAIEFLRKRDAVDLVVDDAVIAVDVNDAVRSPHRSGQLHFHLREGAVVRHRRQDRSVQRDVAAAAVRCRRSDRRRHAADFLKSHEGNVDGCAAAPEIDDRNPLQAGRRRAHAVRPQREGHRKTSAVVGRRSDGEIVAGCRNGSMRYGGILAGDRTAQEDAGRRCVRGGRGRDRQRQDERGEREYPVERGAGAVHMYLRMIPIYGDRVLLEGSAWLGRA